MTALAAALAVQRRMIATRRKEAIDELRRHEADCCMCGDGPTDGIELRMFDPAPEWTAPEMICATCWNARGEEADFTDLPVVWPVLREASR